jgi:hypothetical protein
MADRKISDLTALTAPAAGDYLPIVDISEASAANKNKRITIEELLRGAPDGTAAAPSIGFESDPNTGIYSPGADQLAISTGGTERARIDSSGRLLVGTSSAQGDFTLQLQGDAAGATAAGSIYLRRGLNTAAIGGNVGADLGSIDFGANDGTIAGRIECLSDATWSSTSDTPGRLVFSTTADGASSPTERMRIGSSGEVIIDDSGNLQTDAVYVRPTGGIIGTDRLISAASAGSTTATVYIGNAAIQVSSDARIKKEIEDTTLDALTAISQVKVKDFLWDDPTDASYNNRNARGKWTGLIAQELVEILPFVVNAPRKEEDGSVDYESEALWTLDQSQLCPVLIKAIQQQQEIIAGLEARLSALEAA